MLYPFTTNLFYLPLLGDMDKITLKKLACYFAFFTFIPCYRLRVSFIINTPEK